MSNRNAPLYVAAHDATVWIVGRCRTFDVVDHALVGAPLVEALRTILCAVTVALSFPADRKTALGDADRACAHGRVLARLARDAGPLTDEQVTHLIEQLDTIGRMIGGWRRAVGRPTTENEAIRPGEAPSAGCVEAPS